MDKKKKEEKKFAIGRGLDIDLTVKEFLTRNGVWREKKPAEAYTFFISEVKRILRLAIDQHWPMKPEYIIPAEYDPKFDRTITTGEVQNAYKEDGSPNIPNM